MILTLRMDESSQEHFDRLRDLHFPPERNHLRAHLTLFHKLPGDRETEISTELREICQDREPFTLAATGLRFLGRGVA
jgi:2'-5' RNA ligase